MGELDPSPTEMSGHLPGKNADSGSIVRQYFQDRLKRFINFPEQDDSDAHSAIFEQTVRVLDTESVLRLHNLDRESNPVLAELFNIYTSMVHNQGPYYSAKDIPGMFRAVASEIFSQDFQIQIMHVLDEPESLEYTADDFKLQELLGYMPEKKSSKPGRIWKLIEKRMEGLSSLESGVSIAVRRTDDGYQRTVRADTSDMTSIEVLEWIRQGNADKAGPNKYRVRSATYRREPDPENSWRTLDGWFTNHWYEKPNYWTTHVRNAMADIAGAIHSDVPDADIVFIGEGGIFKGTMTPGTDVDTSCYIFCNSVDQFEQIYSRLEELYTTATGNLAFTLKEHEMLRPRFFDRSSGSSYWRRERGEYRLDIDPDMSREMIQYCVRNKEQGIILFKNDQVIVYPKPEELRQKAWYVQISSVDLSVQKSSDNPFQRFDTGSTPETPADTVW